MRSPGWFVRFLAAGYRFACNLLSIGIIGIMVNKISGIRSKNYRSLCSGRIAVYIDSFNLYYGLKTADMQASKEGKMGWMHYYWYNPQVLAEQLTPQGCELAIVRFFTANVLGGQKDDTPEIAELRESRRLRQIAVLDAIEAQGIKLIKGVYSPRHKKCENCKEIWTSFEEKMTDTKMAVQIMVDAMHDRFDTCVVLSADADLVPPLESLSEEFPAKKRVVVTPPHRNAKHHLRQISECFKLTREIMEDCQMPNPVIRNDGYKIQRPREWNPRSYLKSDDLRS